MGLALLCGSGPVVVPTRCGYAQKYCFKLVVQTTLEIRHQLAVASLASVSFLRRISPASAI